MNKKVLIVDDDSFSRKILKNFLSKLPCLTFEAPDGAQALALIAAESPDLVLLDVNMPVMNGLETLQAIRSSPAHRDTPVMAISAYGERTLVMKFIELGISGFVLKPLRPGVTIKRLETVFQSLDLPPAGELLAGAPDVRSFLRGKIRAEVIAAAQESIGVLTSGEISVLDEQRKEFVPRSLRVRGMLPLADGRSTVVVEWFTGEPDAERLASRIAGTPTTMAAGAVQAVSDLTGTIAGRIRAALGGHGFVLEQREAVRLAPGEGAPLDEGAWESAIGFRTSDGEEFLIATWVMDGVPAPVAAGAA